MSYLLIIFCSHRNLTHILCYILPYRCYICTSLDGSNPNFRMKIILYHQNNLRFGILIIYLPTKAVFIFGAPFQKVSSRFGVKMISYHQIMSDLEFSCPICLKSVFRNHTRWFHSNVNFTQSHYLACSRKCWDVCKKHRIEWFFKNRWGSNETLVAEKSSRKLGLSTADS